VTAGQVVCSAFTSELNQHEGVLLLVISVLFEGDSAPTPVDDIIWCTGQYCDSVSAPGPCCSLKADDQLGMATGYRMDFPFLSDELSRFIKPEDNEVRVCGEVSTYVLVSYGVIVCGHFQLFLYDYVFPPDPALSNVAFIGYEC